MTVLSVPVLLQPLAPLLSMVLLALVLDCLCRLAAPLRDRMDPVFSLPAALAGWIQRKLDRKERTRAILLARGRIAVLAMLVAGILTGIAADMSGIFYPVMVPVLWFSCLHLTNGWTACTELLKLPFQAGKSASEKAFAQQARQILERRRVFWSHAPHNADHHSVMRVLAESMAVSLHRGWLTPVLWAIAGLYAGLPPLATALAVIFLLEAQRVVVASSGPRTAFAQAFIILDAVINFVPARVAALFWVLGAVFTPAARPLAALRLIFAQGSRHHDANDGWPLAAVAGALGVAFPADTQKQSAWIGGATASARISRNDIKRLLWLHAVTVALVALVFTAMLFLSLAA